MKPGNQKIEPYHLIRSSLEYNVDRILDIGINPLLRVRNLKGFVKLSRRNKAKIFLRKFSTATFKFIIFICFLFIMAAIFSGGVASIRFAFFIAIISSIFVWFVFNIKDVFAERIKTFMSSSYFGVATGFLKDYIRRKIQELLKINLPK